ncbi:MULTISPECIES: hypothetical protein [Archaeoglobus]|nr:MULTISPECIES: hypothetical protein [Archaeoglobus]
MNAESLSTIVNENFRPPALYEANLARDDVRTLVPARLCLTS